MQNTALLKHVAAETQESVVTYSWKAFENLYTNSYKKLALMPWRPAPKPKTIQTTIEEARNIPKP